MSEGDSSDSVSKKLDALLKQMEASCLKLYDKIDSLAGTIRDIDHQQWAHHFAITRLEQGRSQPPATSTTTRSLTLDFGWPRACAESALDPSWLADRLRC